MEDKYTLYFLDRKPSTIWFLLNNLDTVILLHCHFKPTCFNAIIKQLVELFSSSADNVEAIPCFLKRAAVHNVLYMESINLI